MWRESESVGILKQYQTLGGKFQKKSIKKECKSLPGDGAGLCSLASGAPTGMPRSKKGKEKKEATLSFNFQIGYDIKRKTLNQRFVLSQFHFI